MQSFVPLFALLSPRIPPHLDACFLQAAHTVVDQYGNPQMPIYPSFRLMVDEYASPEKIARSGSHPLPF